MPMPGRSTHGHLPEFMHEGSCAGLTPRSDARDTPRPRRGQDRSTFLMQMNDIDFLIIGATKSATTWLQQCLQQDPSIYMPDPELHYFSREFHRGDKWYLDQ